MTAFDPRLTPARPDLAARHLAGKVEAGRFVDGVSREVVEPLAPVRRAPAPNAPLDTEALKGERVTVYEETEEGWSWGQLEADGHVGWLPSNALAAPGPAPTHKVTVLRTLIFPGPDIKLPPLEALSLGARIAIARIEAPFAVTVDQRFLPARHVAPLAEYAEDFVAIAEQFAGVPYLWGGRSSFGLDCSGLVQVALNACGLPCPRDSDMQEAALGHVIEGEEALSNLQRGDLIFWKGHVAIVRDAGSLVHANAFHMAVAIEPIMTAVTRIRDAGSVVTCIRRIDIKDS
jgi:cell wall-associated NlpC family hydrolase